MKYCQKCRVMLMDEVEVCPICGQKQLPVEEYAAKILKKKKCKKTLLIVIAAVIAAVLIAYAVIMLGGKPKKTSGLDAEYTIQVTDNELLAQFAAYAVVVMPELWSQSDEATEEAIEYYNTNSFEEVAAGFEQLKTIKPIVGDVESITFDDAVTAESGRYKLIGTINCVNGKVKFTLVLSASGYVDELSFELKEVPFLEKARDFLVDHLPE